jgi:CO/xanthine dehydrogenase Mo-binding subunit
MSQSGEMRRPKGAGEAGNVGALAAIMNAVVDAVSPRGIAHIDMPATPEKVWRTIRAAQGRIELRPRAVPTPA